MSRVEGVVEHKHKVVEGVEEVVVEVEVHKHMVLQVVEEVVHMVEVVVVHKVLLPS